MKRKLTAKKEKERGRGLKVSLIKTTLRPFTFLIDFANIINLFSNFVVNRTHRFVSMCVL